QRPRGKANQRSKFHHGLIEIARTTGIEKLSRSLPALLVQKFALHQPPQNTLDIAIHHRHRLVKGDAGNGRRCIAAHPRQLGKLCLSLRKSAQARDLLRCSLQSSGPAIVAEPTPRSQHGLFTSTRQPLDTREPAQKFRVTVLHHRHARLLQHDFGDQNVVGITFAAPRQSALFAAKPAQQLPAKLPDSLFSEGSRAQRHDVSDCKASRDVQVSLQDRLCQVFSQARSAARPEGPPSPGSPARAVFVCWGGSRVPQEQKGSMPKRVAEAVWNAATGLKEKTSRGRLVFL